MRRRRLMVALAFLFAVRLSAQMVPLTPRVQIATADHVVVALVEDDPAAVEDAEGDLSALWEEFTLGNLATPPIVFAPLPESSPFSPHDQELMAYWNLYQPDLFRVGAPAVTWDFGNGVSEIAGFPDSAKLEAEFGQPWIGGAISFVAWRLENGRVVEVDIALSPGQRWTLDEAEATRPGGPFSFRRILLANLGTAWGLRSSFNLSPRHRESAVNLNRDPYNGATLFSDDTAAVRAAFGEAPIRDGLVSAYSIVPFPLAPRRFSLERAVKVKQIRVRTTAAPGDVRNVDVGRIIAPASLPPGVYFLAFRLRATGDEYPGNDTAWSEHAVSLNVKAD